MLEKVNSNYESLIYPVTTATQYQKKNLKAKKFQPILRIIKSVGRNLKKLIAN